jgi:hypothetical protein
VLRFTRGFVLRRCHPRVGKILAQVTHGALVQRVPVVRAMQDALGAVQLDADSRPRQRLDVCTHVIQQRLDLAPVDVPADRIVEDGADQVLLFVIDILNEEATLLVPNDLVKALAEASFGARARKTVAWASA